MNQSELADITELIATAELRKGKLLMQNAAYLVQTEHPDAEYMVLGFGEEDDNWFLAKVIGPDKKPIDHNPKLNDIVDDMFAMEAFRPDDDEELEHGEDHIIDATYAKVVWIPEAMEGARERDLLPPQKPTLSSERERVEALIPGFKEAATGSDIRKSEAARAALLFAVSGEPDDGVLQMFAHASEWDKPLETGPAPGRQKCFYCKEVVKPSEGISMVALERSHSAHHGCKQEMRTPLPERTRPRNTHITP